MKNRFDAKLVDPRHSQACEERGRLLLFFSVYFYRFRIQENVYLPADRSDSLPLLLSNHRPRENRGGKHRCLTGVTLSKRQIH